jgi:hypothetical protein
MPLYPFPPPLREEEEKKKRRKEEKKRETDSNWTRSLYIRFALSIRFEWRG